MFIFTEKNAEVFALQNDSSINYEFRDQSSGTVVVEIGGTEIQTHSLKQNWKLVYQYVFSTTGFFDVFLVMRNEELFVVRKETEKGTGLNALSYEVPGQVAVSEWEVSVTVKWWCKCKYKWSRSADGA